jgi:mRNA interferase MazF
MTGPKKLWVPDRQNMIWIQFNPQIGKVEMRDEHPMLVLSTKAFNERTGLVIGMPMTHSKTNESNPFAIKYVGPKKEVSYVLTHQPKSLDWRIRGARPHPWKNLPPAVFEEVCEGLNSIIRVCV